MEQKKLKYLEYLKEFPNCPPDIYTPIDNDSYRWIHIIPNPNDYLPRNLISEPPARILDKSDLLCKGYGLSLFNSLLNAMVMFKKQYNKRRKHLQPEFVNEYGDAVAKLKICENDGLAGDLNTETGHFTFHELENTNLNDKVVSVFNIFDANGEFELY